LYCLLSYIEALVSSEVEVVGRGVVEEISIGPSIESSVLLGDAVFVGIAGCEEGTTP
jgi:hypothetical protein